MDLELLGLMANFLLLIAEVVPKLWDPLESTCRHASLSIL